LKFTIIKLMSKVEEINQHYSKTKENSEKFLKDLEDENKLLE
jgi:hypothetical protein